jgi:hypothetical protein
MGKLAPVHYLRANERNWSPPAVIFLDTETRTVPRGDDDVEVLRLWVARYLDRRTAKGTTPRHVTSWGETADGVARWITEITRNRETVWLYCHNLGFDLSTTRLPLLLIQYGWEVRDAAIGGKAPWIRMGKGNRVLTLTDSWSWLPDGLDAIGEAVRVPKPALPPPGGSVTAWRARCGADVDILATAILGLMDWWDEQQLGNWTLTGAACGWNAYRHRPTTSQIVVNPEPELVAQDRRAVHGGRRGTWSIGDHRAGPFLELDFAAAYPQIAAELVHPVARNNTFTRMALDDPNLTSERWGVVAKVHIHTDTPRWPVRIGRATWYPVGDYWADLAGPDIAEALRLGVLAEIGPGQLHKLGRNMNAWGRWVLAVQRNEIPGTPPVARIAAKAWGRSVIGKWASRSFERTKLGPAPTLGWGYEEGWNHTADCAAGMVDIAGQRWMVSSSGDPDNAYPAILAWVEAEVRVRLGRVIDAIGEGAVLQCDTDGLIVAQRVLGTKAAHGHLVAPEGLSGTARVAWVLNCLHPVTAPLNLRVKNRLGHVSVLGPQHVVADGQRRFSGMAKGAELGEDGRYRAKLWPTLQWQLANGSPQGYVRPLQTMNITGPFPTGWILRDRTVVPVETEIDAQGETRIVPWHLSRYAAAGMHRADIQHPQLDALI